MSGLDARGWLLIVVGVAAVVEDLRSRNISNWISGGALVAGLGVHLMQRGWSGLGHAALGAVIGFFVFLIFYLLGGMGGGDVKLMAGMGALLGDDKIVQAAIMTALCGGVMAVLYLAARGMKQLWLKNAVPVPASADAGEKIAGDRKLSDTIPYAPAIAAGAWLTLLGEM